ncbi:hypothetical protein [Bdellovibrio sp. ArHS]|uniref:hypothetical protein n=1 Tax=Bdellovibrio sp. ArHS TaxID=1569284 RepID=UPI000B24D2D6|nr:hypothetical protein [Bdellovibrio sp. ArHS]
MGSKGRSPQADDVKQEEAAKNGEGIVSRGPGPRSTSKISTKSLPANRKRDK